MKNNIFKVLGLFTVILLFFNCEKELDLSPLDTVSDESFWKTASDFEKAANAFYLGGSAGNGTLDLNSDINVGHAKNDTSSGLLLLENGPGWAGFYSSIRAATKITENYEIAENIQSEIARYAAEARFFRAQAYANLIRTFGDVPLIKRVLDLDSEELDAPRTSRTEVIAYILEDLDWAIANLPEQSELTSREIGRVTKGAALTLKSRVFLFEGTWAKYHSTGADVNEYLSESIEASQAVMASGEYEIYTAGGPNVAYRNLFIDQGEGSRESILARRYNQERGISHNTTRWVRTFHSSPTKKLADMYVCTDGLPIDNSPLFQGYDTMVSEFENRDPRMLQTFIVPGSTVNYLGTLTVTPELGSTNQSTSSGYLAYKFWSDEPDCHGGQCFYDYMVMRYGEVLLNLAEALYERDGSITDSDLDATINVLRDRVGVAHLTNALVAANSLNMLWQIRNERTVELAYEGFRYNDLKRWKEAENLLPVHLRGIKYTGTEYETTPPNNTKNPNLDPDGFVIADDASTRFWDDKLYLLPVPIGEIQLNPNLTQNPGW
jgi:hypothetical protein